MSLRNVLCCQPMALSISEQRVPPLLGALPSKVNILSGRALPSSCLAFRHHGVDCRQGLEGMTGLKSTTVLVKPPRGAGNALLE